MGPSTNFVYLFNHLSEVIAKQSDQVLQEQLGIGLSQYKILMVLEWNPRIQQKAIADALGQTEASISRQVKLLKAKNLLTSKIDPTNKRKHIGLPSPLGMQITEAANDLLKRNFTQDFSSLSEDQIVNLSQSLNELHRLVCRAGKAGACDHQLG